MTKPEQVLKHCPKCGSAHFVFDGSKSFKCQECQFHFFINSACAVAAVIVNKAGEILLTRRAFEPCAGMLDLPGGFVDPLETAEQAVVREIKEELNLEVVATHYMQSFPNEYVFSGYSVFTTDLGFICEVNDFSAMQVNDDVSAYEFKAEGEIDFEAVSSESIRQVIKAFFAINRAESLDSN